MTYLALPRNAALKLFEMVDAAEHVIREQLHAAPTDRCRLPLNRGPNLRCGWRRLPVTVKREQRPRSRAGRYHLSDPYFRFYFQFLEPYVADPPLDPDRVLGAIKQNLPLASPHDFSGRPCFLAAPGRIQNAQRD